MHAALAFLTGICVAMGGLLLLAAFSGVDLYGVSVGLIVATATLILALAAIGVFMLYKGLQANMSKIKTGKEALIGAQGIAVTDLNPNGEIRVLGEFWQAHTKTGSIIQGQTVQVVDMEGMFLVVNPS